MRFIVSRSVAPVSTILPFIFPEVLTKFGSGDYVEYLSAYSMEVNNDSVSGFLDAVPGIEGQHNLRIRAARRLHSIAPPVDPPTPPASLQALDLEPLWETSITGKDVNVGVIELGFGSHESIDKAVASHHHFDAVKKDFVNGGALGNKLKLHGTFAAGLIAGAPIDNIKISVAADARLHLVELPEVTFEDDFALALQFLTQKKKCKVISVSLGTWEPLPEVDEALVKAREDGALPIVAIGNSGKGVAMWPGACSHALSVGYCDEDGVLAATSGSTRLERSRHALVPLLLAPGVMLVSAEFGKTKCQLSGSSFATPLVAGLAALLWSDPKTVSATPDQVEVAILHSCGRQPEYDERCAFGLPSAEIALAVLRVLTAQK